MSWVYIVECADGSYYVGSTRDIDRRYEQHATGLGSEYTRKRLPITLVFAQEYDRIDDAYAREKQIQGWSRAKRRALIEQNYDSLPSLSGSRYRRESAE
ncbi:MAG TPA: GIY-YIG nuclease family protein [Pseudolysinimonas sp.]|nr:GIY-YIG nuclease family protein [Pseudolysinimonas sp.]